MLAARDENAAARHLLRSKNLDTRANCGYNVVNGNLREGVKIPHNMSYNDSLKHSGESILGIKNPNQIARVNSSMAYQTNEPSEYAGLPVRRPVSTIYGTNKDVFESNAAFLKNQGSVPKNLVNHNY